MKALTIAAIAIAWLAAGLAQAAPGSAPTGEQIYRRCYACHAIEPGNNSPAGPTLAGIVGRPIAAEPGFNYSPALRRLATRHRRWTPDLLDRFLADPEAVARGTEMGFIGLRDPDERRTLIDWLGRRTAAR